MEQNNSTSYSANPTVDFILYGIFLNFMCLFGMIGNLTSVLILSRKLSKSPFSVLLVAFSLSDFGVCLFYGLFVGVPVVVSFVGWSEEWNAENVWNGGIVSALFNMCYIASIYFTLAISLERFVAVFLPLKAPQWLTLKHTWTIAICIAVFSITCKIPMLILYTSSSADTSGSTLQNVVNGIDLTLEFLIPLPLIVVVNFLLLRKIMKSSARRRNLGGQENRVLSNTTKILVAIISMYIPCIVTGGLVFFFTLNFPDLDNTSGMYYLLAVLRLLLTFNSASNICIYCLFNREFREGMGTCCAKFAKRDGNVEMSTKSTHTNTSHNVL